MFYRIVCFKSGKELFPETSGASIISLFISCNFITIVEIFIERKFSWEIMGIVIIFFYLISSKFLFNEAKFEELEEKWQDETKKQIYVRTSLMVLYFAVTIFLFFFISIQYPAKLTLFNK
jgi:archaellum biogenesis protein FlaJ (TadC family)